MATYTISTSLTKCKNHKFLIHGFEYNILHTILCEVENKYTLNIDDQILHTRTPTLCIWTQVFKSIIKIFY